MKLKNLFPYAVAMLALAVVTVPAAAAGATGHHLNNARDATAAYSDPAAALAGGYDLLTDAAGIACIDQSGAGGMGVHYVKGALVQSGTIDAARPQALVYEVGSNDHRLQLVALEYVVLKDTWDGAHSSPPTLFGQDFMLTPAGNRFGLPAYYSLHAWIGKDNPSGMFNPYNPQVTCGGPMSADRSQGTAPMTMNAQGADTPEEGN